MRRGIILLVVSAALLLHTPLAGDPIPVQTIEDPATSRPDRAVHDVRRVEFRIEDSHLVTTIHFACPFSEMMFEGADLYIDCDGNPATGSPGTKGAELQVRAAVGSRFHPNCWVPGEDDGLPAPLSQRTTQYAIAQAVSRGLAGSRGTSLIWARALAPPTLGKKSFSFRTPLKLLKDGGQVYNRDVNVWLRVEGTCSEHPIPMVHRAADEGIPVSLDGDDAEWGGGTRASDDGGELHRDARFLDILKAQVEHQARELFVGIWLEETGFTTPRSGADIADSDEIVIAVEPLGAAYLSYEEYRLRAGNAKLEGPRFHAVARDRFVEVSIPRPPEQTEFRIVVWSDAIRVDLVPDAGTFKLDTTPGRKR